MAILSKVGEDHFPSGHNYKEKVNLAGRRITFREYYCPTFQVLLQEFILTQVEISNKKFCML